MNDVDKHGFTLVEVLVVMAVIAVLGMVMVLVLNPAVMLQKARDSQRLTDLKALNGAIDFYQSNGGIFIGTSSVVYVSIPDPLATSTAGDQCQGLGFTAPPSGWSYHCEASSTYRNTNGTGWVPINFNSIAVGNPLGTLPVDPQNQTSTGFYYTYAAANGQYQLYAHLEATANQALEAGTGGYDYASYKLGTNVNIAPFAGGLSAYWPFNEGSGTIAYDYSGMGSNGTLVNGPIWTTGVMGGAIEFNGVSNQYVAIPVADADLFGTGPMTVAVWVDRLGQGADNNAGIYGGNGVATLLFADQDTWSFSNDGGYHGASAAIGSERFRQWQFITVVRDSSGLVTFYIDGIQSGPASQYAGAPQSTDSFPGFSIGQVSVGNYNINGVIDEFQVYKRALTATEVASMYSRE